MGDLRIALPETEDPDIDLPDEQEWTQGSVKEPQRPNQAKRPRRVKKTSGWGRNEAGVQGRRTTGRRAAAGEAATSLNGPILAPLADPADLNRR